MRRGGEIGEERNEARDYYVASNLIDA